MDEPLRVAILVYSSVELPDMNGPPDTFVKANRINSGRYQVYTIASAAGSIINAQVPDSLTAWILEISTYPSKFFTLTTKTYGSIRT